MQGGRGGYRSTSWNRHLENSIARVSREAQVPWVLPLARLKYQQGK